MHGSLPPCMHAWLTAPLHACMAHCHAILQVDRQVNLRKLMRVRSLYRDIRRRCYLFDDLHCIYTAVERCGPHAMGCVCMMYAHHVGCVCMMYAHHMGWSVRRGGGGEFLFVYASAAGR